METGGQARASPPASPHSEPMESLRQRGAHHPGLNAYNLAPEPVSYDKGMCPETLSVLERTVFLGTRPDRSTEELEAQIEKIKEAVAF